MNRDDEPVLTADEWVAKQVASCVPEPEDGPELGVVGDKVIELPPRKETS